MFCVDVGVVFKADVPPRTTPGLPPVNCWSKAPITPDEDEDDAVPLFSPCCWPSPLEWDMLLELEPVELFIVSANIVIETGTGM